MEHLNFVEIAHRAHRMQAMEVRRQLKNAFGFLFAQARKSSADIEESKAVPSHV